MQLSTIDIEKVRAAIEKLRIATGTSVRITSIESRCDGTPVYLMSPEGWLISILGERLRARWWQSPVLTLTLTGHVIDPSDNCMHTMTDRNDTSLPLGMSLAILEEGVNPSTILELLLPAIRAEAAKLEKKFVIEAARGIHAAQLNDEFGLDGRKTNIQVGDHSVSMNKQRSRTREDRMVLTMDIYNLSAARVRAIMKVLEAPEPLDA